MGAAVVVCAVAPAFAQIFSQTSCAAAVTAALGGVSAANAGGVATAAHCNSNATSNSSYPLQLRPQVPGVKETATIDSVESTGVDKQFFEAQGKVDLRSPSRQVLSDWMRYEFEIDTIKAKGNVVIRSWQDLIAGPELE